MSGEAEMRAVLLHAADKLDAVKDRTTEAPFSERRRLPADVMLAMGYAEGVLRLLASYLKVDPAEREHATPEPGWSGQPNGQQPLPAELPPAEERRPDPRTMTERNAAVIAAMAEEGAVKRQVAERFGISPRRVTQILEAAG